MGWMHPDSSAHSPPLLFQCEDGRSELGEDSVAREADQRQHGNEINSCEPFDAPFPGPGLWEVHLLNGWLQAAFSNSLGRHSDC